PLGVVRGQRTCAAEADAVAPRGRILRVAEGGAEPGRVAAVPTAAADHLALSGFGALGIPFRLLGVRPVPIGDPLPHVADDVVWPETRPSGLEAPDGRRGGEAIVFVVERGERGLVLLAPCDAFAAARV